MRKLNGTEMKALFVLSIVVPLGLLSTFRLTGVLREPVVERIALEPVTLNLARPSSTLERIDRSIQSRWTQEEASVTASIDIFAYLEGALQLPFGGFDGLEFRIRVKGTFANVPPSSILLSLHPLDSNATVVLDMNPWSLKVLNGSIVSTSYLGTNQTDAYIRVNMLNSSFEISDQISLIFLDENQSHELQITVEVFQLNKTPGEIITLPLRLEITSP